MYAHVFKGSKDCTCWAGYERVPGTKPCAPGSCQKVKKSEVPPTLFQRSANADSQKRQGS